MDVRPESDFLAGHLPGAFGLPLEELPARVHELPPRHVPFSIIDSNPDRAHAAAEFLRKRGVTVSIAPWDRSKLTESGPSRVRLWRPAPFLAEALGIIRSRDGRGSSGTPRALDVACGSGRDAVYLALEGYEVDAIDVLPDALSRAQDLARRSGMQIRTIARDLEQDRSLPVGRYDLVTVFRYLHRDLFPALRAAVAPGGYIAYETFHEQNRQTGLRPSNPAHLLQTGELARAFDGFAIVLSRDAVEREGRFFSALLARRPTVSEAREGIADESG